MASGSASRGCLGTIATYIIIAIIGLAIYGAWQLFSPQDSSKSDVDTVNGYSVKEYNADVDNLAYQLNQAKSLDRQIEQMGDPNSFTTQSQVDQYNNLVSQYNAAAEQYNSMAKSFASKYKMQIDGTGSRPADPDQIDLPPKR